MVRKEFEEPIVADPVDQPPGSRTSPSHDRFYERLTTRNRGLVADDEQRRLRQATILIAGCGPIGGSAIEPLVRLGAEHLVLAEPNVYEVHNLNRQQACLAAVGRNKAAVLADRVHATNPTLVIAAGVALWGPVLALVLLPALPLAEDQPAAVDGDGRAG